MELIIEQLTRGHKLIGCHKFAQQNISIGRAYDNDLIISDPHVCPLHLNIHFDGEHWIIHDDNSVNGSYVENSKQNVQHHVVKSGDIINFGKSSIRLLFPSHPVAQSVPFSPFEQLVNVARHPAVMAANSIVFLMIILWGIYVNKPIEVNIYQLTAPALAIFIGFSMWPALVALISHFTKNEARVLHQFGICFVFFNLMWLSDTFESIIYFNTSANMSITNIITVIPIALAFSMFWLNCYIGFHMTATRRFIAAASLTLLLFGGSSLVQMSKQPEFSPMPNYDATLMTPTFLFTTSSSVDSFLRDSERLFEQTKKAAEKEKSE